MSDVNKNENTNSDNYIAEKRGRLFFNKSKLTEKSPDMTGKVQLDGKIWKLSVWKNQTQQGEEYLSISATEFVAKEQKQEPAIIQQTGGQPIIRPEPANKVIVDLSSSEFGDLDEILGLSEDEDSNPFNS